MAVATAPDTQPDLEPAAGGDALRRVGLACRILLLAVAGSGLLGGLTGTRLLDSAVLAQVPMAPSTAILFLALGVLLCPRPHGSGAFSHRLSAALPLLVACAAFLNGMAALLGREIGLFDLPFRELSRVVGVTHVNMSPATATLFVFAGLASWPLLHRRQGLKPPPQGPPGLRAAGLLGAVVAVSGVVFLLGYAFGSPLLYHSGVVPMARSTALAFVCLGVALVCEAGPELLPVRIFAGPSPQASLMRAFVPLTAALSLAHSLFDSPVRGGYGQGSALLAAALAVATAAATGLAVMLVARRVGGSLDRAESQRALAERNLRQALNQKTVMLKELHHRVKNNMQIVSSLSLLQAEYVADPRDRVLFEESQARIRSMALVHEDLYKSDDLAFVDMGSYVPRLVEQLLAGAAMPVHVTFEVAEVRLPITLSVPCGMLLNELVMNAMKHAFRDRAEPELCVALREEDGEVVMEVADNGPGLPQDFEFTGGATFGMVLVESLTQQLHGTLATDEGMDGGVRFQVRFPLVRD